MNEEELKMLASQLAKPDGDLGIQVAQSMNESNIGMTCHSIEHLHLKDSQHILEIGHGNAGHLELLLSKAKNINYTGLEISSQMNQEAKQLNEKLVSESVNFILYDGETLPFLNDQFDAAFTVNTLYFWKEPAAFLHEIHRVLKPGGILNITFADKSFMEQLPFTKYGFTLYSAVDVKQLIAVSSFSSFTNEESKETIKSKTGEIVNRKFYTFTLVK